jgi:hypothetical protein
MADTKVVPAAPKGLTLVLRDDKGKEVLAIPADGRVFNSEERQKKGRPAATGWGSYGKHELADGRYQLSFNLVRIVKGDE